MARRELEQLAKYLGQGLTDESEHTIHTRPSSGGNTM